MDTTIKQAIVKALTQLTAANPDHARVVNQVGWSAADQWLGHMWQSKGMAMTDQEFNDARHVLWKYKDTQLPPELTLDMWPEGHPTAEGVAAAERAATERRKEAARVVEFRAKSRITQTAPDVLAVRFNYSAPIVERIRALNGRRWNPDAQCWEVRPTADNVKVLQAIGFDVSGVRTMASVAVPVPVSIRKQVVLNSSGHLNVLFPYDPAVIAKLKETTNGHRFIPDGRYWEVRCTLPNVEALKKLGFPIPDDVAARVCPPPRPPLKNPEKLAHWNDLLPFQRDGVRGIEGFGGRALLADDMGLGKTIQALSWIELHPELRPAIVICPATLKLNWQQEARKWMSRTTRTQILSGSPDGNLKRGSDLFIINYEIVDRWGDTLKGLKPKVLVMDECHRVKNPKAQCTKAVRKLAVGIPHVIPMSGTPLVNRPMEIYQAIHMVQPDLFPSAYRFGMQYCGPKVGWGGAMEFKRASNTEELHSILRKTMMIRRLKSEVLKDLPAKRRSVVPIELSNRKEYEMLRAGVIQDLLQEGQTAPEPGKVGVRKMHHLALIEKLKQAAIKGKLAAGIAWVSEYLEADGKLVVMATHHDTIDALQAHFGAIAVTVDGRVSQTARNAARERFQTDPDCRLFIGNIKAAGVGLTLTAASSVAFLEFPWTPGELTQAEDRIHRIGQTESCNIYLLAAERTIDVDICELLAEKAKVLGQVLDGQPADEAGMLDELIERLKNGRQQEAA